MEMSQRDAEWEESGADLLDAPVVLSQSPGSQLSMGGGADAMDEDIAGVYGGEEEEEDSQWAQVNDLTIQQVISRIEQCMYAAVLQAVDGGGVVFCDVTSDRPQNVGMDEEGMVRLGPLTERKLLFSRNDNANGSSLCLKMYIVMNHIHKLLLRGKRATLRQLYYSYVDFFQDQTDLNRAVEAVQRLLGATRVSMGIVASARGFVTGHFSWQDGSNDPIDCREQVLSIPGDVSAVRVRSLGARCIVVCEKDTVFNNLVQEGLCDVLPCVLMTGQGYPPMAARWLLCVLQSALKVPAVCLVDNNPAGFYIFLTYKHGARSVESYRYGADIKHLGVTRADFSDLDLPDSVRQPFRPKDDSLLTSLRSHPGLSNPLYREVVEEMGEHREKMECEAINMHDCSNLCALVQRKFVRRETI